MVRISEALVVSWTLCNMPRFNTTTISRRGTSISFYPFSTHGVGKMEVIVKSESNPNTTLHKYCYACGVQEQRKLPIPTRGRYSNRGYAGGIRIDEVEDHRLTSLSVTHYRQGPYIDVAMPSPAHEMGHACRMSSKRDLKYKDTLNDIIKAISDVLVPMADSRAQSLRSREGEKLRS